MLPLPARHPRKSWNFNRESWYSFLPLPARDCVNEWTLMTSNPRTLILIITMRITVIHSLRDVQVKIPTAVKKHDDVVLHCYYDMEGDSLYSVKWYKGRREFYRYSPKETPAMKTFPLPGVIVKVVVFLFVLSQEVKTNWFLSFQESASNESQLTLMKVIPSTTGKYNCEVSAGIFWWN